MAVSQHTFSKDYCAWLCLGTDCHILMHESRQLVLRNYIAMYASVPVAQKKSGGKISPNVCELSAFSKLYMQA